MGKKVLTFVCDVMLGKLARWLRLLGWQTLYEKTVDDDVLIKTAVKQNAVLLTRDKKLAQKANDFCTVVLLYPNDFERQFRQLALALKLKTPKTFSTEFCPSCGGRLDRVSKLFIKNRVWPRVYKRHRLFWNCRICGQIYWQGTHTKQITQTLKRLLQQVLKYGHS